jgi:cytochrome P450
LAELGHIHGTNRAAGPLDTYDPRVGEALAAGYWVMEFEDAHSYGLELVSPILLPSQKPGVWSGIDELLSVVRDVGGSAKATGGHVNVSFPVPLTPEEIQQGNARQAMAKMYFERLFDLRRKDPGDDLTTQLLHAEEDGSKLSNDELYANIILLFGAGHETTVNLIGNGLLALHRNPDQLALLKARPELTTNAIEEFLRYDSSVQLTGRVALEDIEDLGGKRIPKGESVLCLLGSANHDPAVYPDHPERLDITRPNVRPLSFGGGIHFCLGAQLARIEAEVAISTLLRRIPDLRLDDAVNPEWRPTFVLRGLKRLPASW